MALKIRKTTVIPYPEEELNDLKELIKNDGMLVAIQDNTGITPPTTKSIVETGKGQKVKVDKLRNFVKEFKNQFAQ